MATEKIKVGDRVSTPAGPGTVSSTPLAAHGVNDPGFVVQIDDEWHRWYPTSSLSKLDEVSQP